MIDLYGKNIRIKTFKQDDYDIANEFLFEHQGHIIDIQFINDNVIIIYEETNRYYMVSYVNEEHGVTYNRVATEQNVDAFIDAMLNLNWFDDCSMHSVSVKEITKYQYNELTISS